MAKFNYFDTERASYNMPPDVIITKMDGFWVAIYNSDTCVWQGKTEPYVEFFIRASNELRKIHAAKV